LNNSLEKRRHMTEPEHTPHLTAARLLRQSVDRLRAFVFKHPGRVVLSLVLAAAMSGFVINALLMQGNRHPAPLFASFGIVTSDPVPVPRPVPLPPPDPLTTLAPQIGEPIREVLFVQRALNKLGYGPIQPDGILGPATQQAVDRFAKDRKWPRQEGVSRRLVAELSEASGLRPD
jgi:hypothetical protein